MKHIDRLTAKPRVSGNTGNWQERHLAAVLAPRGPEAPLVGLIRAWLEYADQHKRRYQSGIGDDGVLGVNWSRIGRELRALLNGESGNLDCGTLNSVICGALQAEDFDPDTL